jgi:hypothetical protein
MSRASRESFGGAPLVHLDSIGLPHAALYTLKVQKEDANEVEREVTVNTSRARGCAFNVASVGNYIIAFESELPKSKGRVAHDGISSFFADSFDNLYADVGVAGGSRAWLPIAGSLVAGVVAVMYLRGPREPRARGILADVDYCRRPESPRNIHVD